MEQQNKDSLYFNLARQPKQEILDEVDTSHDENVMMESHANVFTKNNLVQPKKEMLDDLDTPFNVKSNFRETTGKKRIKMETTSIGEWNQPYGNNLDQLKANGRYDNGFFVPIQEMPKNNRDLNTSQLEEPNVYTLKPIQMESLLSKEVIQMQKLRNSPQSGEKGFMDTDMKLESSETNISDDKGPKLNAGYQRESAETPKTTGTMPFKLCHFDRRYFAIPKQVSEPSRRRIGANDVPKVKKVAKTGAERVREYRARIRAFEIESADESSSNVDVVDIEASQQNSEDDPLHMSANRQSLLYAALIRHGNPSDQNEWNAADNHRQFDGQLDVRRQDLSLLSEVPSTSTMETHTGAQKVTKLGIHSKIAETPAERARVYRAMRKAV